MGVGESFLDVVREHVGYILSDAAKDPHEKLRSANRAMVHYTTAAARAGDSSVGKFFTSEAYLGQLEKLLGQPTLSASPQEKPYPASSCEPMPRAALSPFEDFSVDKLDYLNPDALYQLSKVVGILIPSTVVGRDKARYASCLHQRLRHRHKETLLESVHNGKSKVFGVRGRSVIGVLKASFGEGVYWESDLSPALVARMRGYVPSSPSPPSYPDPSHDSGNGDIGEVPERTGVNGDSVVTLDKLAQIIGEEHVGGLGVQVISVGTTRCVKLRELHGKLTSDQLQQLEGALE